MKNEESKEEEESQKGRSVSHRHVASSSNDALGSVAAALGMENVVQGPAVPAGMDPHAGDLVGGVRPPIYITPWGERYHTSSECSSLRRTRRLIRSSYCPECAGDVTLDGGIQVFCCWPRINGPLRSQLSEGVGCSWLFEMWSLQKSRLKRFESIRRSSVAMVV